MELRPLLSILSDGNYYSGVYLGEKLGVSRTAIWKMIAKLEELGISVECIKGKGYRIQGGIDLLIESEQMLQALEHSSRVTLCETFLELESTSTYLSNKAHQIEMSDGRCAVCLAEKQTKGRGRRGRHWVSPFGENIYLSMAFYYPGEVSGLAGLSLAIGVAIADVLSAEHVEGVELKWPNDLLIGGKKLGGVLIELSGELTEGCTVLVGVGLNVAMSEEREEKIDQPWTSVNSQGSNVSRSALSVRLVDGLIEATDLFLKEGLSSFSSRWDSYDYLKGKSLDIIGRDLTGVGLGINDRGELLINSDGNIVSVNAGEVSVRLSSIAN